MTESADLILRIPETVREDTAAYRGKVRAFLDGESSPVAFRAYRVPMGVYEQRTAGKFMVRVRIPAGLALPDQLSKIAELSKLYGNGVVHVTTRQDLQIHEVKIEDTPSVLEGLLESGLSSRGGGGNTVRNISACPRAGICPAEAFDVTPYAIATAEYLLANRTSFNLPRKYKIAFSGCSDDCALASVADLGFFAHESNGVKGFVAYAGGGFGSSPAVAVKIEDFLPATEVIEVAEAIRRLFDAHGDRSNKHKARLRYVVARVGVDEFVRLYRQYRQEVKSEGLTLNASDIRSTGANCVDDKGDGELGEWPFADRSYVLPEKTPSLATIRLWPGHGDVSADDLSEIARIAKKYSRRPVRTTQRQGVLITGIARSDIDKVACELGRLSSDVIGASSPRLVACTGAATCKLGLCLSRGLSDGISEAIATSEPASAQELTIRISGCPNSCGHHCIADLGFQGRARRVGGRLVPYYDVFTGAHIAEGESRFASVIGSVPAKRIPQLVAEALQQPKWNAQSLTEIVARHAEIDEESLPEDYYHDFGSDEPFSLAGRGPGECGAGVMDIIKLDIEEAKNAIGPASVESAEIYRSILIAARALLVTFGLEPGTDRQIFAAFRQHLIEPGWVKPDTGHLLDSVIDWRMGDVDSIADLAGKVRELTARVEELFLSLDAGLKFRIDPISSGSGATGKESSSSVVDLRGVACPMNFVKAKIALEQVDVGDILEVLLDEGEPVRNVPTSFAEQGQEIVDIRQMDGHFAVMVRRGK